MHLIKFSELYVIAKYSKVDNDFIVISHYIAEISLNVTLYHNQQL